MLGFLTLLYTVAIIIHIVILGRQFIRIIRLSECTDRPFCYPDTDRAISYPDYPHKPTLLDAQKLLKALTGKAVTMTEATRATIREISAKV